jgi:hypothetical protein
LTLAGRVLKPEVTEELRDEQTLLPFEDEKKLVPLLQTIVSDEIVDCLESVEALPNARSCSVFRSIIMQLQDMSLSKHSVEFFGVVESIIFSASQ